MHFKGDKMTKEDFTEDEYAILKIMFHNMEQLIESLNNSDISNCYIDTNIVYNLAKKLNILDIYIEW